MRSFAEGDLDAVAQAVSRGEISYQMGAEAELPPVPDGEPKVVCSLRLPADVYQRLRDFAAERGVKPTSLMRDWVIAGLAASDQDERTISVADLLRVVSALPGVPAPGRHAA
jgi:hypothetical protein